MPDNGSVFEADKPQAVPTKAADGSFVEVLVGEGKKYKSVEALAKAYMEVDDFAETLKSENAGLRQKQLEAKTIDDVLKRMETKEVPPADKPGDRKAPTADEIANIVKNTVTGMESAKIQKDNLLKADAEMKRLFGDKAQEVFDSEANTPELKKALQALASVDPVKFVALFTKGSAPAASTIAASGSVNTAGFGVNNTQSETDPTTKAYYDAIRKKNKNLYYSSDFQLQMHEAAQANPDKFFGRKK
jgi:hypothetical protein